MYTRPMFRRMRSIIPNTIASTATSTDYKSNILNCTTLCNITGSTLLPFGENFDVTIHASTGAIYVLPEADIEPTDTNAFLIYEGDYLSLKIKSFASVKGNSTTAAFQAVIWG